MTTLLQKTIDMYRIRQLHFYLLLTGLLLLASCGPTVSTDPEILAQLPDQVDFNYHIKPILSDRCYACHGPDENTRKAGLRLDDEAGAFTTSLESGGKAIVPGSLRRSGVIHRIYADDPETLMPPPESNLTLTEYEKALITKWIEQGAEWKPHWAFIPLQETEVPEVAQTDWVRNPIDHFVWERLTREGLSPSPEANKERLLRRVSLDLTGLPPTIEEIDAFLADDSPEAYEKVVDRLVATDAYAERMAMEWMDVARYADSHGMHADGWRNMWPWRDWVLKAFGENMPFDQFATWQLAGDLLPDASKDQILATAFHRNHPMTAEGGVVVEEFRLEYVFDRTNTTATAFMGLTMECARCHDHKFDPISQEEYYQLSAFFNNVKELGMTGDDGNYGPMLVMLEEDEEERLSTLDTKIKQQESEIQLSHKEVAAAKNFIEQLESSKINLKKGLSFYLPMDRVSAGKQQIDRNPKATLRGKPEIVEGKTGKAIRFDDEFEVIHLEGAGLYEMYESFSGGLWVQPEKDKEIQSLMANSGNKNNFWRGWNMELDSANRLSVQIIHSLPDNYLHVVSEETLPKDQWSHAFFTYDGSGKASGIQLYVNGKPATQRVRSNHLTKTILPVGAGANEREDRPLQLAKSYRAFTGENGVFKGKLDEVRIYDRALSLLEVAAIVDTEADAPVNLKKYAQANQEVLIDNHLKYNDLSHRKSKERLAQLRKERMTLLNEAQEVMVMKEMPEPRTTFLLNRGQYDAPLRAVKTGTPKQVLDFSEDLPANRLGLARWLFNPQNPLTARVTVNRYWQLYFGQGLVSTPQDFGNQGVLPTYPALLDWLALQFINSGWDIRAFQKLIVMSATYRQDSKAGPELLALDPGNDLLARGPRNRLSAEMIRDNALAASGLLVQQVGGPSVKPYQPPGLWIDKGTFSHKLLRYVPDTGEGLYRRSLYTFIKRTSPPPTMAIFDAPERNTCTVSRQTTNTPMQALVLLNDPQFVEAARVMGARMLTQGGESLPDQLKMGFRLATGMRLSDAEVDVFSEMYQDELSKFQADKPAARKLLTVGDSPQNPRIDITEAAAMTMVASMMLNHDQAYTKR